MTVIQFPVGARGFLFFFWGQASLLFSVEWWWGVLKQPGYKADYSPASSAKIKNEWSHTSNLLCSIMACTEITNYLHHGIISHKSAVFTLWDSASVFRTAVTLCIKWSEGGGGEFGTVSSL